MKEYMTISDLHHILDGYLKRNPEWGDYPVVVKSSEPIVGPSACVVVRSANMGIDWDTGKFFLFPKENMQKVVKNESL